MNHAYPIIERGGLLFEPDTKDFREELGIFNPAVAGEYLLYRAVAKGNYSRIMAAKLSFERQGEDKIKIKAERLGQAVLEPEHDFELVADNKGGVEDPRVTKFVDGGYVMLYTGFGFPKGFICSDEEFKVVGQVPVIALAQSTDGLNWEKHGRINFEPYMHHGISVDLNHIPNKDAVLFSEKLGGRYVMYHRPMFSREQSESFGLPWRAIWCSDSENLTGPWTNHRIVLKPFFPWEKEGVGAGVPPIKIGDGWVNVYHGFFKHKHHRDYGAGIFMTALNQPCKVIYRSECALLSPSEAIEQEGYTPDVVFPTAVWKLEDDKNSLVLFWGGADSRIMWGQLHLPGDVLN